MRRSVTVVRDVALSSGWRCTECEDGCDSSGAVGAVGEDGHADAEDKADVPSSRRWGDAGCPGLADRARTRPSLSAIA